MGQYEIHMVWYQRYLARIDKGILKTHYIDIDQARSNMKEMIKGNGKHKERL